MININSQESFIITGSMDLDTIQEIDPNQELKVTFYPELFLQRRIWILNILRKENITKVMLCLSHIGALTLPMIGSRCGMW